MERPRTASEALKAKFGDKLRFEIVEQNEQGRTSQWRDQQGIIRALSTVLFVEEGAQAFPEVHARIQSGAPLGETFVATGLAFERRNRNRICNRTNHRRRRARWSGSAALRAHRRTLSKTRRT